MVVLMPHAFDSGEHKKEEFISLCPIARVPLLRDSINGLVITERLDIKLNSAAVGYAPCI